MSENGSNSAALVVSQKITATEEEIRALEARLALLKEIAAELSADSMRSVLTANVGQEQIIAAAVERVKAARLGPKNAIQELVSVSPGIFRKDVVDLLSPVVDTKANNKVRTVSSTIYNMIYAGELRKDNEGRLYPAEPEE